MEIHIENSWKEALAEEIQKPYFSNLIDFVTQEYKQNAEAIFPQEQFIFRALNECALSEVKVVILGQDPYPTKGHAHGLCFSVEPNVRPFPKSLMNIFKEIENDIQHAIPENGSLLRWASQGVLLLNSVLTVREGQADSHSKKGWEQFTDAIISQVNEQNEGVVFLLWGSKAQQKLHFVNQTKNLVLEAVHPSPLSAYRGFFGCKHFSRTNEYLISVGKDPIHW
jgi:uracil-DNA glycosylase